MIRWLNSDLWSDFAHELKQIGTFLSETELRSRINPAYTFKIRHLSPLQHRLFLKKCSEQGIPVWTGKGEQSRSLIVSFGNREQIRQFCNTEDSFHSLGQEFGRLFHRFELSEYRLEFRDGRALDLSTPVMMGILNVTPDSFSDGGRFLHPEKAVARALQMVEEGAKIIDIGAESTRPGSETVPLEKEWNRIEPVLDLLRTRVNVPISVDTYKAEIARRALEMGAAMINDISGLTFDPKMAEVVATYQAPLVLMHIKGTPRNMQVNPHYDNLMEEIFDFLHRQVQVARQAGITQLILDPGIGFGKRWEDNFEIHRRIEELKILGYPLLIGASRKSFVGRLLDVPPTERVWGTGASVALSAYKGVQVIRVHDVSQMKQVMEVAHAILRLKFS